MIRGGRGRLPIAALAALAALAACAGGCRRQADTAATSQPPPALDRFPHGEHEELSCTDCHDLADVRAGRPARPGRDDHAPCARSGCHREAFTSEPGELCETCHERVAPLEEGESPLVSYPPEVGGRALAATFSHAGHMDFDAMEGSVGFHVSCEDCHVSGGGSRFERPGHAVCGRCHAPEAAPPGAPTMASCRDCHRARERRPDRRRHLIVGDLRFAHAPHRADRRGNLISCTECHTGSAETGAIGDHDKPETQTCVGCHDDSERVPPEKRMRKCETCHATKRSRLSTIAPRSHLPKLERPEDHTLAFRRDHEDEASRQSERCARCHTFMSGSPRDTCDECHQVMRPRDHTVTWREYDHGPAAAADSQRCATCHGADFCTSCHSVTPRSHFPRLDFARGGHATAARFNPRSCITCHDVQRDCVRAGCHVGLGAR